jgi:hypothetical protein
MIGVVDGDADKVFAEQLCDLGIVQDRLTDDQAIASRPAQAVARVDIEEDGLLLPRGLLAGLGDVRFPSDAGKRLIPDVELLKQLLEFGVGQALRFHGGARGCHQADGQQCKREPEIRRSHRSLLAKRLLGGNSQSAFVGNV